MDEASQTGSTFTLAKQGSGAPVAANVTYDAATKKPTLDPEADLEKDATYTATVKGGTSGAKDVAGNPLAEDKMRFSPPPPESNNHRAAPGSIVAIGPFLGGGVVVSKGTWQAAGRNQTFFDEGSGIRSSPLAELVGLDRSLRSWLLL